MAAARRQYRHSKRDSNNDGIEQLSIPSHMAYGIRGKMQYNTCSDAIKTALMTKSRIVFCVTSHKNYVRSLVCEWDGSDSSNGRHTVEEKLHLEPRVLFDDAIEWVRLDKPSDFCCVCHSESISHTCSLVFWPTPDKCLTFIYFIILFSWNSPAFSSECFHTISFSALCVRARTRVCMLQSHVEYVAFLPPMCASLSMIRSSIRRIKTHFRAFIFPH